MRSIEPAFDIESTPVHFRRLGAQLTWYSLVRRSPFSLTAASGMGASGVMVSVLIERIPGTGRLKFRLIAFETWTLRRGWSRKVGSWSDSGNTSLLKKPLYE